MKYIFIIFITLGLLLNIGESFAINYKSNIPQSENPNQENTASNINRAQLLCTHVINFQKNIENIGNKYALGQDSTIVQTLLVAKKMQQACKKIQTTQLEKQYANEVITSIVTDLTKLNNGIKQHLKLRIEEIEIYKQKYARASIKIATQLDILNTALEKKIYSTDSLSSRDKKLLSRVQKLKNMSIKLKGFGSLEIYKKSEIRSALIRIIQDIRKEIQNIREL